MSQERYRIILAISLIAIVTFLAFSSSLNNGFTNWDDNDYITGNPLIQTISCSNLKSIFISFNLSNYHPLVLLSFLLEYHFFQLNPFIYHLDNLLLHLMNSFLFFYIIFMVSHNVSISFIAAILFGIHPLHVESVVWVTERKDVLSTFFFLQAVICYLYFRKKQEGLYYFLALITFLLALLSKAMAVTLPVVLLLFDYLLYRKFDKWALVEKMPFFTLSVFFGVLNILAQKAGDALSTQKTFEVLHNLFIATSSLVFYIKKTILPLNLSAIYPSSQHRAISALSPEFLLPVSILFFMVIVIFLSRRWTRKIVFGSLFFFVTILPVLKLIPVGDETFAADRYMYIPSIGLFYLAGVAFHKLYASESVFHKVKRVSLTFLFCGVVLAYSFLTYQRCNVWQDNETLWLNVLQNYPEAHIAHHNLGVEFKNQGRFNEAIKEFRTALQLRPFDSDASYNLGVVYFKQGRWDEAIEELMGAVRLKPGFAGAHYVLGLAYMGQGRTDRAIEELLTAVTLKPDYMDARYSLGVAYQN
ncbi:MAG: tetratricopeptide repeat protein, partial [Thermodesulfobacteriota bacterium]